MIFAIPRRETGPEWMDRPDCDPALLFRTLDQFEWTNRLFSRYRTVLRRWVLDDMRRRPDREYHLADLGAGGLDIPNWLLGEANRLGLRLRVTAVDNDPRVLSHVRSRAAPGLSLVLADARDYLERTPDVDYLFGNHFLHHLPGDALSGFLRRLAAAARRRFILSDLLRSRWSYAGYSLFARGFLRGSYAFDDGRLSILRGFRPDELARLAAESGVRADVYRLAGGRLILTGPGTRNAD